MFIFDTDVISNVLKMNPSPSLLRRIACISPDEQFTTAITIGELVFGAFRSRRPQYFLDKLKELVIPNIQILSFNESSAYIYGELRAELEAKGQPIAEPDLRIASIALNHDSILVTGNTKHFSRIPALKIEDWI
jgi:tRNA(fMet)-specific endonuclease VapC